MRCPVVRGNASTGGEVPEVHLCVSVDLRGRYLNLPASRLHATRKLVHGDFALQIRELHKLLTKSRKE
jgi:hypothetical protein